jgi:uncharacterized protein with HEPN domain
MAKRKARPILEDMLAYAEEAYAILDGRDGGALRSDRIRLLAVTRAVEIVGEAANHGYDSVSADIVAKTVRDDFPDFIAALRGILAAPLPDGS